jgi:hypothetical protein
VFCPNCGTQNESAATPCKKCGFKLSGVSVPKFKGTMMLNSDQTVQELIDEHRRKQAQGTASDRPKSRASEPPPSRNAASNPPPPPPGSPTAPKGTVLQPPRAGAAARRRMGGTMLGVAPQAGGLNPPRPELTATPPPVRSAEVSPVSPGDARLSTAKVLEETTDPFAGTFEMPQAESVAVEAPVGPAPDPSSMSGPGHTRPFVMSGMTAGPGHTRPLSLGDITSGPGHTRPLGVLPEEHAPLTPELAVAAPVAATAALPRVDDPAAVAEDLAAESRVVPPRLRALDIALIVCTFGLYGIVIWAKQRRLSRS